MIVGSALCFNRKRLTSLESKTSIALLSYAERVNFFETIGLRGARLLAMGVPKQLLKGNLNKMFSQ